MVFFPFTNNSAYDVASDGVAFHLCHLSRGNDGVPPKCADPTLAGFGERVRSSTPIMMKRGNSWFQPCGTVSSRTCRPLWFG